MLKETELAFCNALLEVFLNFQIKSYIFVQIHRDFLSYSIPRVELSQISRKNDKNLRKSKTG